MTLFKKPPFPPVNDSRIRVVGRELGAVFRRIEAANNSLTEIYTVVHAELKHADPATKLGKELERIALDLSRVSNQLSLTTRLFDCRERMLTFGVDPAITANAVYPETQEVLICP